MRAQIPVRVLNTNKPDHKCTVIQQQGPVNPNTVTSIAYKENQHVLTISSTRMFGEVGFLARVFAACEKHGVVVDVVSTSEVSVSLIASDSAKLDVVSRALAPLGEVTVAHKKTILVVVGQHFPSRPGLGTQVLAAVAQAGINIHMVSYALGAINLSLVIDDADIGRAVKVLHGTLFSSALR